MSLEAVLPPSNNDFFKFIVFDAISAIPYDTHEATTSSFLLENLKAQDVHGVSVNYTPSSLITQQRCSMGSRDAGANIDHDDRRRNLLAVQGKKKRRRKPRVRKNKEEAETQRMAHITVERNRRKLMNEHLAVLKSLMPQSYVQRGDQASIVGGAIEFVKELEQLLQSLEARKYKLERQQGLLTASSSTDIEEEDGHGSICSSFPFAQFFVYSDHRRVINPANKYFTSKTKASTADIEVTLIETHANLRILSKRGGLRQLSKLVAGFQTLYLTVLHINVTTTDYPLLLVLYSISIKLEEGCQLTSGDDIAAAVHHMLRIIEEEASLPLC